MPRPDDFDDPDDRLAHSAVHFPPAVRAAGIIWLAFGAVALLAYLVSFAVNMAGRPGGGGFGMGCGVLFAIAFLATGYQTVTGRAKGTVGNGLLSLLFGLLYTCGTVILVVLATGGARAGQELTLFVAAGIVALLAVALVTAGMLAIAGRTTYAEWLAAHGRGRRRRRTPEEEDYDDRPRRRRVRDEDDDQ